jgi:hypothetical protein
MGRTRNLQILSEFRDLMILHEQQQTEETRKALERFMYIGGDRIKGPTKRYQHLLKLERKHGIDKEPPK